MATDAPVGRARCDESDGRVKRSPLTRKTPLRSIARIKPRSAKRRSEADAYAELRARLEIQGSLGLPRDEIGELVRRLPLDVAGGD